MEVNVGDRVIVYYPSKRKRYRVMRVTRTTATQFTTHDGTRFLKSTWTEYGTGRDVWSTRHEVYAVKYTSAQHCAAIRGNIIVEIKYLTRVAEYHAKTLLPTNDIDQWHEFMRRMHKLNERINRLSYWLKKTGE